MIQSAGIVIIHNKELLLVKPKNINGKNFSIPKGIVEDGESLIDAAIRETFEEIGLRFEKNEIVIPENNKISYINYGVVTKELTFFLKYVNNKDRELIEKSIKVQDIEIELANFFTFEEALELIFWRQEILLCQYLC